MGLITSRRPDTWNKVLNEKDYVLHWSSEVLARVQDNVINEDTFLMDYDNDKVDAKINAWIAVNQARAVEMLNKYPNMSNEYRTVLNIEMEKLALKLRANLRKDYNHAYSDIRKFNKRVDLLGENERKIHFKIQKLEEECVGNARKFRKKLRPLSTKVFDNLIIGEKMIFQDKRLKIRFTKKIYDIDRKNSAKYAKRVKELLRDFENSVTKYPT